jgi:predicted nucleic acid-binding protein
MRLTSDNVFWDTNVLVYCYDKNLSERKVKAQALSIDLPDIMISTQVMNELAFVLSKKQGLNWNKVADVLHEVTQNFTIHTNTAETIIKATSIAQKYQFSFYDSLIISAALESGCNTLYSEDMQHGQHIENKLKIVNPFV